MTRQAAAAHARLVHDSGPQAGSGFQISGDVTRVGRSPDNDLILTDPLVSARHFEIRKEGDGYMLRDLGSTNGTFLNGERIREAPLSPPATVRIGEAGPAFSFVLSDAADLDATMRSDTLVSSAVARVRAARKDGAGHQTTSSIVREMIARALSRAHRKWKVLAAALAVLLAATVSLALLKISGLRAEKRDIDIQIARIEALLEQTGLSDDELARLAENLNRYEAEAREIETTMLYRAEGARPVDPIAREIAKLMAEFGAETYHVPPGFVAQVKKFIAQYQGPNRAHMEAALNESHKSLPIMRRILAEAKLPEDLAFVALVESAVSNEGVSSAGAAGIWQFTPVTARAYGLQVGGGVDERLDVRKSTQAACKLLRDLILEFGSGSSVMLALAAYNAGVSKVKQGIRRVSDPIQQRNFWHLYRIRALPSETREYVPKVVAAMIIARAPEKFGF